MTVEYALDYLSRCVDGLDPIFDKAVQTVVSALRAQQEGPLMEQFGTAAYVGHLRDLVQAEQDGRLVMLPCKVGDTVWFNTYAKNATVCLGVLPHKVSHFDVSVVVPGEYIDTDLPLYEFGKSVFLTLKEAEAALKRKEM